MAGIPDNQVDSRAGVDIATPDAQVSTGEALPPIKSLLAKSEKACQKLTAGTWQHAMLEKNIAALQVACTLMSGEGAVPLSALQSAEAAIADMTARTEKALVKFAPRTSQHSLQQNRLNALQLAGRLVKQAIRRASVA